MTDFTFGSPSMFPFKTWQVSQFVRAVPFVLVSTLVVAVALVLVLAPELAVLQWLPWLTLMLLVLGYQWVNLALYRRAKSEHEQEAKWFSRFAVGVGLMAAVWGSAGLLMFPAGMHSQQLLLVLALVGLSATLVSSLACVFRLAVVFQMFSLLPVIGRLLWEMNSVSSELALLAAIFLGVSLISAWRLYGNVLRNLNSRQRNFLSYSSVQESENRFHTLVENIADAMFLHDGHGRLLEVNAPACVMLGYTREELLALTIYDLERTAQSETLTRVWADLVPGQCVRMQGSHRRKDGGDISVDINLCAFSQSGAKYFLALARDMSAVMGQAEQLRRNEERLRAHYLAIPIPTFIWQREGNEFVMRDANDAAMRYTDGRIKEYFGVTASTIHRNDPEILGLIAKCYQSRNSIEKEIPYFVASKGQRYLAAKFAFVPPDTVMVHAEDITERKRNEHVLQLTQERFSEAQRIAHIGYWALEPETRSLEWSDEIYEIFGLDRATHTPTLDLFLSIVHAEDKPLLQQNMAMLFEKGEVPDMEYRIVRPDGSLRTLASVSKSMHDQTRNAVSFFGILQDISELKLQQQMLIDAKEDAERANQAKSEFLSSMSHELRTPMNAILGFTQLLEMDVSLNSKHRQAIAEIHRASNHLLELINEVLDLSQIESQRVELVIEEISVASVIDETETLITPIARRRQINVVREEENFNDEPVLADRTRVRQVLLNLLSNAVKYNRQGGIITIKSEVVAGERVRVSVSDTGEGLDEAKLAHLFTPFQRMGAEKTEVEGTGIGLVIAKKLLELMGGSIAVRSTPGEGSEFSFELPISLGSEELRMERQQHLAKLPGGLLQRQRVRILYVEDNPANLRLVENILSQYDGVEMFSAPEPLLGLELAQTHLPDVILLDINLPGMDGFRVMKKLKENGATTRIPVIAISANAMPRDVERGVQAGFLKYLTKPINVLQLMQTLEDAVGNISRDAPSKDQPSALH